MHQLFIGVMPGVGAVIQGRREAVDALIQHQGLASRSGVMGQVLGIVYRCVATHLIKKAWVSCKAAQTGAVTLIQRLGSALDLSIHFHMLFLGGVSVARSDGSVRFLWVKAATSAELNRLAQILAPRIGRFLERQGLLERDAENSYLAGDAVAALDAPPLRRCSAQSHRAPRCAR